jgi:CheY-like chemotaxis protein
MSERAGMLESVEIPMNILVVDDESESRQEIANAFIRDGHSVTQVDCCRRANELLERETYDAVISDVVMPEETGIDLLSQVRSRSPHVPLFVLVNPNGVIDERQAFELGALALVQKGTEWERVVNQLKFYLQPSSQKGRRAYKRAYQKLEAHVRFAPSGSAAPVLLHNISAGGCFVISDNELPPVGSILKVFIKPEEDRAKVLDTYCVVRWQNDFNRDAVPRGVGTEFLPSDLNSRNEVHQFVAKLLQSQNG